VVEGVAGGGVDGQAQGGADRYVFAVAYRSAGEGGLLFGGGQVGCAGGLGQGQAAGDVVVVQVGFGYVGEAYAEAAGRGDEAVDVAVGVDDHAGFAVVCQVAAVAQGGGLHRLDVDVHGVCSFFRSGGPVGGVFGVPLPPGGGV